MLRRQFDCRSGPLIPFVYPRPPPSQTLFVAGCRALDSADTSAHWGTRTFARSVAYDRSGHDSGRVTVPRTGFIDHIGIGVPDLDAAKEYYNDLMSVLGLREWFERRHHVSSDIPAHSGTPISSRSLRGRSTRPSD